MKRLIIFLIRKRLGLKKYERFKFSNQKSQTDEYYFDNDSLMKAMKVTRYSSNTGITLERPSSVSLNWLLDGNCQIEKINKIDI